MSIILGFLSAVLVLDCIFLILLILIQLPKKEAGIGMAFGGSATETLFGAGSGTVLTKATKYCAVLFGGLALTLAILNSQHHRQRTSALDTELQKRATALPVPGLGATNLVPSPAPAAAPATSAPTPTLLLSTNIVPSPAPAAAPATTNAPSTP